MLKASTQVLPSSSLYSTTMPSRALEESRVTRLVLKPDSRVPWGIRMVVPLLTTTTSLLLFASVMVFWS